jgi:hypothetical protein
MSASLQEFSDDRKIDPSHERTIKCPNCAQRYLLIWDDGEWNSVKDWISSGGGCRAQKSPVAR